MLFNKVAFIEMTGTNKISVTENRGNYHKCISQVHVSIVHVSNPHTLGSHVALSGKLLLSLSLSDCLSILSLSQNSSECHSHFTLVLF